MERAGNVDVKRRLSARICARLAGRAPARSEAGFSLMEAVLAMALFAIVSTALLGVLVSGVSVQRLSRQKTIAEQAGTARLEYVRTLSYSNVGNPGGNPNGTIQLSQTIAQVLGSANPGLSGTVTSKVEWNNNPSDKVATAYRNAAFYKKVTITVTRSDGKQLAQMVTYVSDTNGSSGVNDAEIDVNVLDIGNNTPISGQLVNLTTGPSAPLSDTSDAAGDLVFPALVANPTSGPTAFYNLSMAPPSGYTLLKDDDITQTPSSASAHVQLAPSQTFPTTLRVYKGSTITVNLVNASTGLAYAGNATVTLATTLRGSPASQNFAYSGAPISTSTFSGEPVIPAPSPVITGGYTASVANGFYATAVNDPTVPNNYPTDLTSTFTLTGYPTGTLTATVTSGGVPVSGATVTVTGGPASVSPPTQTTNGSGIATFTDLPAGSGYNVSAQKGGQGPTSVSATVVAGASTNVPIAFPVGSLQATVTWGAAGPVAQGVTVQLTGGPNGVSLSGSSDASGHVMFTNLPAGNGYTVTATSGAQSLSVNNQTVTGGAQTNTTIAIPVGSILATARWGVAGPVIVGASVQLNGPNGYVQTLSPTNGSGQVTFANVPAGAGYTLVATKSGQSTSPAVAATVTSGSTTNSTVPIGSTVTLTVTVNWAALAIPGATVSITGGPDAGSYGGVANASGVWTATVPASPVAGYTYTVTASKNNGAPASATTYATLSSNQSPTITLLPVKTFNITVKQNGALIPATNVTVSITGGPGGTIGAAPAWGSAANTNGSSVRTVSVPQGTGAFTYTIRVYRTGCGTVRSGVLTLVSDNAATTNVTVDMTVASCPGPTP